MSFKEVEPTFSTLQIIPDLFDECFHSLKEIQVGRCGSFKNVISASCEYTVFHGFAGG